MHDLFFDRLRLSRGNALACGSHERGEARV